MNINNEEKSCINCNTELKENELKYCDKCYEIFDMDDCFESYSDEKSECSFCNNIKTLFVCNSSRIGSNNDKEICRDCFFSRCRECNINGNLLIPVSSPCDLKCVDCWDNENIFNGECSLCGEFDYLDYNENLDWEDKNTEFYCQHCFYNEEIDIDEIQDEEEDDDNVPIITKCDCCKIDTTDECSFLMNDIYKNRKELINNRQKEIDKASTPTFRTIYTTRKERALVNLSRLISSFEYGNDLNIIKKTNSIQIHKVSHETKRPWILPDKYSVSMFENFLSESRYIYGFKIHSICSDCLLFGFLECLKFTGSFPNLRKDIHWFYRGKDKEQVKLSFNDNFELVDKIKLPMYINISFYYSWDFIKKNSEIIMKTKKNDKLIQWIEKKNGLGNHYSINLSKLIEE